MMIKVKSRICGALFIGVSDLIRVSTVIVKSGSIGTGIDVSPARDDALPLNMIDVSETCWFDTSRDFSLINSQTF